MRLRTRRFLAAHSELVSVAINNERLCEQATFECQLNGERPDFALYNLEVLLWREEGTWATCTSRLDTRCTVSSATTTRPPSAS